MTEIEKLECCAEGDFKNSRGKQFVKIWDFMLFDLDLKNAEIIIYAVIFAMHRNYCECFMGSREYLAKWSGTTKATVDKALASLEKKELVRKEYRQYGQVRKAIYFINTDKLPTCEMFALENRNRDNKEKIKRGALKNLI